MSGKFMKVRRVVIPTLTLIIMASQLMGCAATSQDETLGMLNNATEIEIEVAEPDYEVKGEQRSIESIDWIELASLTNNPEIRDAWDEASGIQKTSNGKEGEFYINREGENDNNNTLRELLSNTSSPISCGIRYVNGNDDYEDMFCNILALGAFASEYYSDIDNLELMSVSEVENKAAYNTAFLAGLNAYFNLLPDYEPAYANMGSSLTRKEFMAMVFRADTPVQELKADTSFSSAVGETEYNLYAQNLQNNSYLDIESQSLDELTYNGTMTRAEAIYMLVSRYYRDELSNVDANSLITEFTDAKDGGTSTYERGTEHWKSNTLNNAIQNPDNGLPTELYAALTIASNHGIIDPSEDTRWDEALTREDALQLLVNTYANEMSSIATEASTENLDFKTNEEKEADAAAAEEAELQANIEEYKKIGNGDAAKDINSKAYQLKADILYNRSQAEKEADAADGYLGYNLKLGNDGCHYLEDIISGEEIHIGERYDMGLIYRGELDCRADMIKWYRHTHPDTEWTDDEIASLYDL